MSISGFFLCFCFFFFKQKTAYEMRISDWSSDVCSSDLVIGAALLLIERPDAELSDLLDHVKGPDFPTGGIVVDSPETIAHAYETGRGGFRVRARFSTGKLGDGGWEADGIEKLSGGTWQLVISEIP